MRAFFVFIAYQMAINVQFVKSTNTSTSPIQSRDASARAHIRECESMGKITKNGPKIRIIYPYATVDKLKKLFRDLTVSHKSYNDPIVTNFYAQLGQFLMRTTNFKRHEMAKNRELNQPDKLGQQLLSMKTMADRDRLEGVLDVVTKNRELFPPDILESLYGTDTGRSMEAVRAQTDRERSRASFEKAKRRILELNAKINQLISTRDAYQNLINSTNSGYFVSTTTNHEQTAVNVFNDKINQNRAKRDKIKREFAEIFPTSPYVRIADDIAESSNSCDYEHQFNENDVRSIPIEPNHDIYKRNYNLKLNVVLAATPNEFKFEFTTADSGFTVAQLNESTLNAIIDGNYKTRTDYDNIQIALQIGATSRSSRKNPYKLIVGDDLIDEIESIVTHARGQPLAIYSFIKQNGPKRHGPKIPIEVLNASTDDVTQSRTYANRSVFEQVFTEFATREKLFPLNIIEYFLAKYFDQPQQPQQPQQMHDADGDDDDTDDMINE